MHDQVRNPQAQNSNAWFLFLLIGVAMKNAAKEKALDPYNWNILTFLDRLFEGRAEPLTPKEKETRTRIELFVVRKGWEKMSVKEFSSISMGLIRPPWRVRSTGNISEKGWNFLRKHAARHKVKFKPW